VCCDERVTRGVSAGRFAGARRDCSAPGAAQVDFGLVKSGINAGIRRNCNESFILDDDDLLIGGGFVRSIFAV
jgi:hypothetical protein